MVTTSLYPMSTLPARVNCLFLHYWLQLQQCLASWAKLFYTYHRYMYSFLMMLRQEGAANRSEETSRMNPAVIFHRFALVLTEPATVTVLQSFHTPDQWDNLHTHTHTRSVLYHSPGKMSSVWSIYLLPYTTLHQLEQRSVLLFSYYRSTVILSPWWTVVSC